MGHADFVRFAPILSDFRWGFADLGKQSADFVQFRAVHFERGEKTHPQDFSLTKKTALLIKGQFRPY